MMRIAVSVLAGVVAGALAVAAVEAVGHALFPPPDDIDVANPEDLARLMESIPVGALIAVVIAWAAGAVLGGFTSVRISRAAWVAIPTGVILLGFGILTIIQVPHPMWMVGVGLLLPLPLAMWGGRLAVRGRADPGPASAVEDTGSPSAE